jgi:hypothetical protein
MMSLEALSHAASTAFPIFEEEQLRELEKQAGARRRESMPRASPLRRKYTYIYNCVWRSTATSKEDIWMSICMCIYMYINMCMHVYKYKDIYLCRYEYI